LDTGKRWLEKNAMLTSNRIQTSTPPERLIRPVYITGFHPIYPRFRTSQKALENWLSEAHVKAGYAGAQAMEALFSRYGASADQIAYRSHELPMRLLSPAGSDLAQKTQYFEECVNKIFERFYSDQASAPEAIIHVTCTGYSAPSGAQRLVSSRGWGRQTQVLHAYHMGCYAAHPAIRIAAGLGTSHVDLVHTELCSLHLDPSNHDPAQLIIQSLFADGFIKYRLAGAEAAGKGPRLEILATREEIIPDSAEAMRWATGPLTFTMTLSKEVPILLASALPRFVALLCEEAGLDWKTEKPSMVFAIHPGGPRIIELSQRVLGLEPFQVTWSRHVLREHGNMSSATLPHIWRQILRDGRIPNGTLIISLGAGPGLTLSGALFRKHTPELAALVIGEDEEA
jgi:predicted naringenin-chalcone synthase